MMRRMMMMILMMMMPNVDDDDDAAGIDLYDYYENGEWSIMKVPAIRHETR